MSERQPGVTTRLTAVSGWLGGTHLSSDSVDVEALELPFV